MATMHKIMQNLARINADIDKFKSCGNIDEKVYRFMNNENNTSQTTNDLIIYLKEEQVKLSSIGLQKQFNNSSKPLFHHQHCTTPNKVNHFNNKSKPKYSSSKKPRPRIRKTPLKPSNISNILNIQNNINNINNNNNNNKTKIPQKKLTFSQLLSNKNVSNIASSSSNIGKLNKMDKMDIDNDNNDDNDNDFDSEYDENIVPLNLMHGNNKTMVEIKLEQNRKKNDKSKPKVDALQKAKLKRLEQEKREKERKRQKDLAKKTIQENKRKKKLAMQQQQRQQQQQQRQQQRQQHFANNNNRRTLTMNNNIKNMPNLKKTKFKIQTNTNHNNKKLSNLININNNNNNNNNNKSKRSSKPSLVQYAISDYDSDFSDSDLDEENCGKFIPIWARKSSPNQMIRRQKAIDPDTIFGRMIIKTCDLEVLFKDYPSRTKYRQRSASGDWAKDQISWNEENGYKKKMGWI